jgi:DNA polymerase alpha subunit A
MSYEYSEKRLYNQLLYFATLWDVDKAKAGAKSMKEDEEIKDRVMVLAETNKALFAAMKGVVDAYLKRCGRSWVQMDCLFGFALR